MHREFAYGSAGTMRKLYLPIVYSLSCLFGATESEVRVIFRDDFDRDGFLDLTKWNAVNKSSEVNSELQYYTPTAITVTGGHLNIRTDNRELADKLYTSGRVDTKDKFTFQYGTIQWRAKIPSGQGIWPALWLAHPKCPAAVGCADYWPPAVSIIDIRGQQPNTVISTVFYRNAGEGVSSAAETYIAPVNLSSDFHLYQLAWEPDCLITSVDDVEVLRLTDPEKIPQMAMQVIMNTAVGGAFPGSPDATTHFPTDFSIDYIVIQQGEASRCRPAVKEFPTYVAPLVGSITGVLLVVGVLIVFKFYFREKKRRNSRGTMGWNSTANLMHNMYRDWDWESKWSNMAYVKTGDEEFDAMLKRYVSALDIPLDNLRISDQVLGKGEFGIVYKGEARGFKGQPSTCKSKWTTVAVKMTIMPHLDADEERLLGEEIRVMTKIGRHLNVVNLLGIAVKGNPLLVLEYCQYGSLLTYLKMHRGVYFYDHVDKMGQLLPFDAVEEFKIAADAKQVSSRRASFPEENFDGQVMATRDLVSFAYQISRGMEYLVSRSIIHRDLAARNVLVAEKKIVKISDFGMARQRKSIYVLENDQASLPMKWMAPEAIVTKTFCQKTDVWSYGIVLSEIFSLGDMPYIGSGVGSGGLEDFVTWLNSGHQMARAPAAPLEIYALQQRCWYLKTDDRPTFTELREEVDKLIAVDLTDSYLALEEPYQKFNQLNETLLKQMATEPVDQDCNGYLQLSSAYSNLAVLDENDHSSTEGNTETGSQLENPHVDICLVP